MIDDHIEGQKATIRNFRISILVLVIVAILVPERYAILIFLGAIYVMLFEISDRLRTQQYFHEKIAQSSEELAKR